MLSKLFKVPKVFKDSKAPNYSNALNPNHFL